MKKSILIGLVLFSGMSGLKAMEEDKVFQMKIEQSVLSRITLHEGFQDLAGKWGRQQKKSIDERDWRGMGNALFQTPKGRGIFTELMTNPNATLQYYRDYDHPTTQSKYFGFYRKNMRGTQYEIKLLVDDAGERKQEVVEEIFDPASLTPAKWGSPTKRAWFLGVGAAVIGGAYKLNCIPGEVLKFIGNNTELLKSSMKAHPIYWGVGAPLAITFALFARHGWKSAFDSNYVPLRFNQHFEEKKDGVWGGWRGAFDYFGSVAIGSLGWCTYSNKSMQHQLAVNRYRSNQGLGLVDVADDYKEGFDEDWFSKAVNGDDNWKQRIFLEQVKDQSLIDVALLNKLLPVIKQRPGGTDLLAEFLTGSDRTLLLTRQNQETPTVYKAVCYQRKSEKDNENEDPRDANDDDADDQKGIEIYSIGGIEDKGCGDEEEGED